MWPLRRGAWCIMERVMDGMNVQHFAERCSAHVIDINGRLERMNSRDAVRWRCVRAFAAQAVVSSTLARPLDVSGPQAAALLRCSVAARLPLPPDTIAGAWTALGRDPGGKALTADEAAATLEAAAALGSRVPDATLQALLRSLSHRGALASAPDGTTLRSLRALAALRVRSAVPHSALSLWLSFPPGFQRVDVCPAPCPCLRRRFPPQSSIP